MNRHDLLVVGAGPTGIAIGAAAVKEGLDVLLLDKGPLASAIQGYPTDMLFFTTRDLLEIADVPFTIPDAKPNRRQALVYYREVARLHNLSLALYEEVTSVRREGEDFVVESRKDGFVRQRRARAVAVATGYFLWPKRLGVPGEDLPWVHSRYLEPYLHFDQDVVMVGGGNTSAEAALDLWRNGARVTVVHRRDELKRGVKYWVKPDLMNRIEEGSIRAHFQSRVVAFHPAQEGEKGKVEVEGPGGERHFLPADAAYVLIGYRPDLSLLTDAGARIDPETLIPEFDPATCETNVPGLYVAGTIQAGAATDKIFIENSRDHGPKIAHHLAARLKAGELAHSGVS